MEAAVKQWCDANIAINMAYRGSIPKDEPISVVYLKPEERKAITDKRPGKLLYQDATACSASYAFADVYQLDTGEYQVYMDSGHGHCTGDDTHNETGIDCTTFKKLSEVVNYLADFSGHDPNTCGELMFFLLDKIMEKCIKLEVSEDWFRRGHIPVLSACEDNQALIQVIQEYGSRPYHKDVSQSEKEK